MKQGAKLMFASGVMLPIFGLLCVPADNPAPLIAPLTIFLAGLSWSLYHRLFGEDTTPVAPPVFQSPQMAPVYRAPMPSLEAPRPDAANALHPPSVLEHTTRNLESVPRTPQSQTPQSDDSGLPHFTPSPRFRPLQNSSLPIIIPFTSSTESSAISKQA